MKKSTLSLNIIFLVATISSAWANADIVSGRASVIDGDTIEIHGQRIRLHGIDAPEGNQKCTINNKEYRCGQKAAFALDDLINKNPVHCLVKDTDKYKRLVAECFSKDININQTMVSQGWALAYRKYSNDYIQEEEHAKAKELGMWAGDFQEPWNYRRSPTHDEVKASKGCLIKGNIGSTGKKLYHMPGTSAYGRTIINIDKGERWFCNEKDAMNAGWTKANP